VLISTLSSLKYFYDIIFINAWLSALRPAKSSGIRKTAPKPKRVAAAKPAPKAAANPPPTAKGKGRKAFDAAYILERCFRFGEYHLIDELTMPQKAVIVKAADKRATNAETRVNDLEMEVQELAAINERLTLERNLAREEARKRHLRDMFHREEAEKAEIARKAAELAQEMVKAQNTQIQLQHSAVTKVASTTPVSAAATTPISAAVTTSLSNSFAESSPVAASTPLLETTVARIPSLLRRVLTGIASPFANREPSVGSVSSPSSSASPSSLGRLPSSRKRPAPEPELLESEAANVPSTPTPNFRAAPKTLRAPATMPSLLSTISEHTEPSETEDARSRATSYATPCRPRSINKVRAARQSLGKTPNRVSSSNINSAPRVRNADTRDKTLHPENYPEEANKENREIIQNLPVPEFRATKRVKIHHLKEIPHNRPGDAEGTFRFPDLDSDDEMEVDIDAPLRSNIFEESESNIAEQQAQVAKEQALIAKEKAQVEQKRQQEQLALEKAQLAKDREQLLKDQAQFAKDKALVSASPRVDSVVRRELDLSAFAYPRQSAGASSNETPPSNETLPTSVDLNEKTERRLEEQTLRQRNWQINQWLGECQPEHVDGLQKKLAEVQDLQEAFSARELTLPTLQRISELVEGEVEPYLPVWELPEGGGYHPEPNLTDEEAAKMLADYNADYEHWQVTGEHIDIYL
jgi:hypothetical protein